MAIWGVFSVIWVKRDMRLERVTWEMDHDINPGEKKLQIETPSTPEPTSDNEVQPMSSPPQLSAPELPRGRDEEPKPDLASKKEEEPESELVRHQVEEPRPVNGVNKEIEREPESKLIGAGV